jgi:hypothetical protein
MLVVRVELHSAITGEVTEIAKMRIANTGTGTPARGNYVGSTIKKGRDMRLVGSIMRMGEVFDYPRKSKHVWNLVARMLKAMEYK